MSKDRATSEPGGCECMKCGAIFIGGPAHDECGECAMQPCATCPDAPGFNALRESVDDALLIVGSYGSWGPDLNDAHRRQIVLADEVLTLRERLAHWRSFAIHAEEEHAAWKKTAIELDEELRALKAAAVDGRTYTQADLMEAVKTERARCALICDTTPPYPFRPSIEAAHAIRTLKDAP